MVDKAEQYEQLTAYLDGELSGSERAEVEQLLADDDNARKLLETLRQTSRLVGSLPRGRAPANLAKTVTARLERDALLGDTSDAAVMDKRRSTWWRALSIAAGVALVVTAGWLVLPQLPVGKQAEQPMMLADNEGARNREDEDNAAIEPLSSDRLAMSKGKDEKAADRQGGDRFESALSLGEKRDYSDPTAPAVDMARRVDVSPARKRAVARVGHTLDIEEAESSMGRPVEIPASLAKADVKASSERYGFSEPRAKKLASKGSGAGGAERRAGLESDGLVASFDRQLEANVLANDDLRQVPASTLSNRIVVEAGAATRARLLRHIGAFMASNQIPDARAETLPEPIGTEQLFFFVKEQPEPTRSRLGVVGGRDETDIIMNVRMSQATDLLTTMEEVARRDDAITAWAANDVRVADKNAAPEIIRQLVVTDRGQELARRRGGKASTMEADEQDTRRGHKMRRMRSTAGGRGKSMPRTDAGEKASKQAEVTDDLVALAISLRPAVLGTPVRGGTYGLRSEKGAASRPVITKPPSTSQPTSQGAPGG